MYPGPFLLMYRCLGSVSHTHTHMHTYMCAQVRVSGRARPSAAARRGGYEGMAPLWAPNTDGVNPDSSRHVLIERNDISCGDVRGSPQP